MDSGGTATAGCEVRGADPERVELGRRELLDDETYARLAETFRTLADSSRAKIVHSLLKQDLCTCDLAAITGHSEPAISQHLRLLRSLQLVKTRREGKKVYYSLADAHVRFLLTVTLQHLRHEEGPTSPPDALSSTRAAPGRPVGTVREPPLRRTGLAGPRNHLDRPSPPRREGEQGVR